MKEEKHVCSELSKRGMFIEDTIAGWKLKKHYENEEESYDITYGVGTRCPFCGKDLIAPPPH